MASSIGLFRASFAAYLIEAASDITLNVLLYALLRPVSRTLALLAMCSRQRSSRTNSDAEPAPGKWSVREILAHLAETEIVSTWRYRQMIENSGVTIAAFDQNEWVRVGDYRSTDSGESLSLFGMLRQNNLRLFSRLLPEEWQRFGIHSERGKMTVEDLVRQMAGHDLNHIEQIRSIVTRV